MNIDIVVELINEDLEKGMLVCQQFLNFYLFHIWEDESTSIKVNQLLVKDWE